MGRLVRMILRLLGKRTELVDVPLPQRLIIANILSTNTKPKEVRE